MLIIELLKAKTYASCWTGSGRLARRCGFAGRPAPRIAWYGPTAGCRWDREAVHGGLRDRRGPVRRWGYERGGDCKLCFILSLLDYQHSNYICKMLTPHLLTSVPRLACFLSFTSRDSAFCSFWFCLLSVC